LVWLASYVRKADAITSSATVLLLPPISRKHTSSTSLTADPGKKRPGPNVATKPHHQSNRFKLLHAPRARGGVKPHVVWLLRVPSRAEQRIDGGAPFGFLDGPYFASPGFGHLSVIIHPVRQDKTPDSALDSNFLGIRSINGTVRPRREKIRHETSYRLARCGSAGGRDVRCW